MSFALLSTLIAALSHGSAKLPLSRRRGNGSAGASPSQVLLLAVACILPFCGGCHLIIPQKAMRPVSFATSLRLEVRCAFVMVVVRSRSGMVNKIFPRKS